MSLLLSGAELRELTARKTRPAQIRRLKAMGIPYIDDPAIARVTVLRSMAQRAGGERAPANEEAEPDFSWMRRQA